MKRVLVVVLILVLVLILFAGCSAADQSPPADQQKEAGVPATELASDYEFEAFPGSTWYGPDGQEISHDTNIINAITGPDHCDWESGVMMHVGWPLGRDAANISESRQYMRDPDKVFPQESLMTKFEADVELPKTAKYSGYRTDFMELWLEPHDRAAAYLVFADHVERWPRTKETVACA